MFPSISPFHAEQPESKSDIAVKWGPALLAVLLISCESNSYFSSTRTSAWVLPIWQALFGPIATKQWLHIHAIMRKSAHFLGYAVIGLIFLKAWTHTLVRCTHLLLAKARSVSVVLAILTTLLVASADEIHQTMIPQRTGRWQDVVIDTSGTILAMVFFIAITWVRNSLPRLRRAPITLATHGATRNQHQVGPQDLRRCA